MTDKQIIIDGIDVSGCEFYKNTNWKNCYSRDYKESVCQSNPNCHYKQIKRKEQECEELKEILNEGCLHNLTLMTEQRVLLQTLTEIKELLLKTPTDSPMHCINAKSVILQKISECEV